MTATLRRPLALLLATVAACATAPTTGWAAGPKPADTVLTNGAIYTVDPRQPWAEAVAIQGGKFVYVGTAAGAQAYVGAKTQVVDLKGGYAQPGMVDAHVHPVEGAQKNLYQCSFPFTAGPDDIQAALAACVKRTPKGAWIRGGAWGSSFFEQHQLASPKALLDAVSPDNPVLLDDDAFHNVWVNSAALKAVGWNAATADPPNGKILRGADGEPNGVLMEIAATNFAKLTPGWSNEQYRAGVAESVRIANSFGVTAMKDAHDHAPSAEYYRDLDRAGQLGAHIVSCLETPYGKRTTPLDYRDLEAQRRKNSSKHVHADCVKIFLDGVPTAARTAAMLAPYVADAAHGSDFRGAPHLEGSILDQDVVELDRRGFNVKMHAAGDYAIRVGLNAIEAARKANSGRRGYRNRPHDLAHAGYIGEQDIPRFKQLNAVADYSPIIWYPSPIIQSVIDAVGERGRHYWPTRTLINAGATIAAGSDWPAAVQDMNPWVGVEALVTRADPRGETAGLLWKEEAATLEEALRIYTLGGARSMGLEAVTGSIEVGKQADLVVLDRNLFTGAITDVGDARVLRTYFDGREVYAAQLPVAEKVVLNGKFYTVDAKLPWAEAIAIRDGKLLYVGSSQGARAHVGAQTEVIDLQGAYAQPGLVDIHVHPIMGGLKALYECNFPFTATPADIAKAIQACADRVPGDTWIRGGQWGSSFFDQFAKEVGNPREFLDRVSGGHPVVLNDDSGHNNWANTKALQLAGITAKTKNPAGGTIRLGRDGQPDGVLWETAARLMDTVVPPATDEQNLAAVAEVARIANAYGVTALKDAGVGFAASGASFAALDRAGKLTLNVAVCLSTPYGGRDTPLDYAALEAERDQNRTPHVHTDFVKLFVDGVPTPARTAAMLAPYLPDKAHGNSFNGGLHLSPERLAEDVTELDRRGYTVKMHVAGDRSVRVALDAIEAARKKNGNSGLHHELAHAGYISEQDLARFAQLDAIPDYAPILWYPSPIIQAILTAVGERGKYYWPTRSLLDRGALIAAGSDWPAAVPDMNPWVGVEALVTREDPRGQTPGLLWKEEAITLAEAVRIYTLNGARALRLEAQTGSLEVGKSADFVVLDRDLFSVPITDVGDTQVKQTWFEGKRVYAAP